MSTLVVVYKSCIVAIVEQMATVDQYKALLNLTPKPTPATGSPKRIKEQKSKRHISKAQINEKKRNQRKGSSVTKKTKQTVEKRTVQQNSPFKLLQ